MTLSQTDTPGDGLACPGRFVTVPLDETGCVATPPEGTPGPAPALRLDPGKPFWQHMADASRREAQAAFDQAVRGPVAVRGFASRWRASGGERTVLCTLTRIACERCGAPRVLLTAFDLTDLWLEVTSARQAERLYRSLVDSLDVSVTRFDRSGKRTFVSDYTCAFAGRSREDLLRGRLGDHLPPEYRSEAYKVLARVFESGEPVHGFVTRRVLGRHDQYRLSNWVPIKDAAGNVLEVQMTATDITRLVKAEERVRRSEQLLRGVTDSGQVGIERIDRDGRRRYVNRYVCDLLGISARRLLGSAFGSSMVPEDKGMAQAALREVMETGAVRQGLMVRYDLPKGRTSCVLTLAPIKDHAGRVEYVQVTVADVTPVVEAQERLSKSEELYRSLVEATGSAVVRVTREGQLSFVSDYTAELYGKTMDELLHTSFIGSVLEEDRERVWNTLMQAFKTGRPAWDVTMRQVVRGEVRHISANLSPIKDRDGNVIELQATCTDVTSHVRMRRQLELYSARVRRAQESERLAVSRFIHDDTIQALLAAVHRLETAQADGCLTGGARGDLEQAREIILDQAEALRRLSTSLRPSLLDKGGLDRAIQWFVRQACESRGVAGKVTVSDGWKRLPPPVEVRLFRIVQEAVNNALRHAAPRTVQVRLSLVGDTIDVTVEDDGQGFDQPQSYEELLLRGRLGLVNMRERAQEIGAALLIQTAPGAGCRVSLRGRLSAMTVSSEPDAESLEAAPSPRKP